MAPPLGTYWLRGATVVALLAASISVAHAEPEKKTREQREKDRQEARGLYDEGLRHYNVAEYAEAIAAFKAAYLVSGDSKLLFNVAQSYRLSGDCEQALRFYKNFLRENPHAANVAEVDAAVARCEAAPPPPAPAALAPPAPAPAPEVIRPVVVSAPPPVPPAAPIRVSSQAPANPGHGHRVAGVAVGTLGLITAGTGVVLGLEGRAELRRLNAIAGEWSQEEKRREHNAQKMETAGQILAGVGATAVAAGIVLYLMGGNEAKETSSLALLPATDGLRMVWACGF
jgi:tetratricopeptide (TPR) repeat protein